MLSLTIFLTIFLTIRQLAAVADFRREIFTKIFAWVKFSPYLCGLNL